MDILLLLEFTISIAKGTEKGAKIGQGPFRTSVVSVGGVDVLCPAFV